MHKWAKTIMECVKTKIDAMGMDNINIEHLEEFKMWSEIAKNISEYDYYYHITEAMEKPENKYGENYDENGKYYTGQPRNSRGEYMSRRMYTHVPESYRDMDIADGRMYYTEPMHESRYDMAKRGFEEAKSVNPSVDNMQAMEKLFATLEDDIKELKPKMSTNEKTVARNKLSTMANAMM